MVVHADWECYVRSKDKNNWCGPFCLRGLDDIFPVTFHSFRHSRFYESLSVPVQKPRVLVPYQTAAV